MAEARCFHPAYPRPAPAVFLDRDGVLIREKEYLGDPEGVELLAGVVKTLVELRAGGYALVVVSNQAGVARGFFGLDAVHACNDRMQTILAEGGVKLDAVYFCPHHPDGIVAAFATACECRKPAPGMLRQAARDLNLNLEASFLVGDKATDLEAAENADVRGILVGTGYGEESRARLPQAAYHPDLPAAAAWILAGGR